MEAFREFVEQLAEVAVLRDRFRDFQQRLVPRLRGSAGQFASGNIAHSSENNIPVRRGSTYSGIVLPRSETYLSSLTKILIGETQAIESEKNAGFSWRWRLAGDFSDLHTLQTAGETPALQHIARPSREVIGSSEKNSKNMKKELTGDQSTAHNYASGCIKLSRSWR
jgi:hypothetical protein